MRSWICTFVVMGLLASPALALHPGTEIIVPAAARGGGAGGSLWVTSLYVVNPNTESVDVAFAWLVRDQANPSPLTTTLTVEASSVLSVDDAIDELFGISGGGGAILVTAGSPVVVNAGIFNRAGGEEFGQGFEGIPVTAAVGEGETTHAPGIAENAEYRTNFYAADASGEGSTVVVDVLDADGVLLGTDTYTLGEHEPVLENIGTLVADDVDTGMVRFTIESGSALVGTSRVNKGTGDPLTLGAWWECGAAGAGLAPQSMVGYELDVEVTPIECPIDPFTETAHVTIDSATEATVNVYDQDITIPLNSYTVGGNLGYVETEIPEWNITDTFVTMIWTSSTGGTFTGGATDYDGSPIKYSGTFEVVAR